MGQSRWSLTSLSVGLLLFRRDVFSFYFLFLYNLWEISNHTNQSELLEAKFVLFFNDKRDQMFDFVPSPSTQ